MERHYDEYQLTIRYRIAFRALLLTLALSVGIEVVQPLLHAFRSSDITDVITNTTGGVLGYALWAIVHACRKKRED